MISAASPRGIGRSDALVGLDAHARENPAHPRHRDLLFDVVFRHGEIDDLNPAAIFDDKVHRRFRVGFPPLLCNLRQRLADIFS